MSKVENLEPTDGPGADKLHLWWELSYAQYLTIPRSVMQSMPDKWQGKMAKLLNELDDRIDWRPENGRYYVTLNKIEEVFDEEVNHWVTQKSEAVEDPFADYDRGRRRVPLKPLFKSTPAQRRKAKAIINKILKKK